MATATKQLEKVTEICKILTSETRLKIIAFLLDARGREVCVNEIADAIDMSHSATSHQLANLEQNNIVEAHRVGQTICYHIKNTPKAKHIGTIIQTLR